MNLDVLIFRFFMIWVRTSRKIFYEVISEKSRAKAPSESYHYEITYNFNERHMILELLQLHKSILFKQRQIEASI